MEIVRTTSEDPAFRALVRELDGDLWRRYGAEQAEYAPHNVIERVDTVVVAWEGDMAVGCGCVRLHHGTTTELKRMFVSEAARGRGVGAQIVAALEVWSRELGFVELILETGNLQHEAIRLYERCGFRVIPNYPPYDGMPSSVCMSKAL